MTSHLLSSAAPNTPLQACGATPHEGSRPSDSDLVMCISEGLYHSEELDLDAELDLVEGLDLVDELDVQYLNEKLPFSEPIGRKIKK